MSSAPSSTPPTPALPSTEAVRRAATYHAAHRGIALVIFGDGQLLFEEPHPDAASHRAHGLASGTKSFAGVLAAAAVADGLFQFDDPAAATLHEWQSDARKSRITIRQLLHLTSGLEAATRAGRALDATTALHTRAVAEPGERFFYAAAPFQAFAELLRRRLQPWCDDVLGFLQSRLLDPLGITAERWRRATDGSPDLSAGASMTAHAWARFGEFVRTGQDPNGRALIPAPLLDACFSGSPDNPNYGLTWWLNAPLPESSRARHRLAGLGLEDLEAAAPADLVYAAGAAKQRLYLSRQRRLVIARQAAGITEALASGEQGPFSDREFWRLLTS